MNEKIRELYKKTIDEKDKKIVIELFDEIIKQEKIDNNIDFSFKIEELTIPMSCYAEKNEIHFKKSLLENIKFDSNYNENNSIWILIKNVYHEIRHVIQKTAAENGFLDDCGFIYVTCNLINDYYDENEYKRNYFVEDIEIDANLYAYSKLLKLLEYKKNKEVYDEIDMQIIKCNNILLLQQRIDKSNKIVLTYDHIPRVLNKILKDNPNIINEYSGLKIFYKENGKEKNIHELLENIDIIIETYKKCPIFYTQMLTNKLISIKLEEINDNYIKLIKEYLKIWIDNYSRIMLIDNEFIKERYQQINTKLTEIANYILLKEKM